ncbi:hypothetical protein L195_g049477, partial [Trifolium pratense]
MSLLPCVEGM